MLKRLQDLVVDYVRQGQNGDHAVVKYLEPAELYKVIDLSLPDHGCGIDSTFDLIKSTLQYSVNSWNPRFMDKLYAGTNPIGVISELLLAVLNSNAHVYSCSPVLTLMEIEVTKAVGELLNMGQDAGGLLCPGGSASNLLAMVTARNKLYPSIKTAGYFPKPFNPKAGYGILKVFTSTHSHYSIEKAALVLGLGTENVVKVPVDDQGRMLSDELERLIQESIGRGETPFFVNATAGTTVLGAFDPIRKMSEITKRYNCWLHVDGSWGGSVTFSEKLMKSTDWLDGSGLADTFTLNPHKLLGVPLQCSMLLTPHRGHLLFSQVNSLKADYLFHGNSFDLGAGTIGCGRRPDALKVFLAWKLYGRQGLGGRIERALQAAATFTDVVRERQDRGFLLVKYPSPFLQVCFWFVPHGVSKDRLSVVTRILHQRVNKKGDFLVDHAPLKDQPDFFRVVINAPTVNVHRDLVQLLDAIEDASREVEWEQVF
ncbi:hypothetical protein DFQ30_006542 [Apophysomyces sp. BC1015]|nr:hypothetical protein DFQ30_006542 [Apophysomyces sp. BC1015]KAG0176520.1 hypothetical protein DFQ29_006010 [Apophysomyces sp. BC1021]